MFFTRSNDAKALSSSATVISSSRTMPNSSNYIRGVNLGGWLVLERYITPYQFAVTDCHVRGDFCWFPQQLSAPPRTDDRYKVCDWAKCQPVRVHNAAFDKDDYPIDEKTLAQAFFTPSNDTTTNSTDTESEDATQERYNRSREIATQWFNYHFEHFVQRSDLVALRDAGITHVRVPLPHWILGDVLDHEWWIVGNRWPMFVRLCTWARELGLQVWPDIHTAPGSQNGFDNSGEALPTTTCQIWSNDPKHISRSLRAIESITQAIVDAGLRDVVTGFGLLNEPFADCDQGHYRRFIQVGLDIVRRTLGPTTAVYVSDMFQESLFNDGNWWLDDARTNAYSNTFLDSHFYQVFDQTTRGLSPRQHIAYTCENHARRVQSCCHHTNKRRFRLPHPFSRGSAARDGSRSGTGSSGGGVARMVGEWSASFDILPSARINEVVLGIAATGTAPHLDRQLSNDRKDFLLSYVQAQMVTFEYINTANDPEDDSEAEPPTTGTAAWFFWTLKLEGGAFAEWDFLRGLDEGWIPTMPDPTNSSASLFGTCEEILFRTDDNASAVVEEFPDPSYLPPVTDPNKMIDDDVVISHGESLLHPDYNSPNEPQQPHALKPNGNFNQHAHHRYEWYHWIPLGIVVMAVSIVATREWMRHHNRRRKYYSPIINHESHHNASAAVA